ncbi:MAG TPA: hypothetical protein VIV58_22355 [Kofleriaceae bacterium]
MQLAGFHLREVEQVVDDDEQVLRRRFDRRHRPPLLVRQRRVEDELAHTQDHVHRRADLVADVRDEPILRAVRSFGRILRAQELLFETLALRQIDRDTGEASRRSIGPAFRPTARQMPPVLPVDAAKPKLELVLCSLAAEMIRDRGAQQGSIVRMPAIWMPARDRKLRAIPERLPHVDRVHRRAFDAAARHVEVPDSDVRAT